MYCTYHELLCQLSISSDPLVTSTNTVLSNLTVDAGGDIYDFVGGTPIVTDALCQAGYSDEIIEIIGGTQIRVSKTGAENFIVDGAAKILHSDTVPKKRGEDSLLRAMEFIDLQTRQWFEPRSKTIRVEGKNSNVMFFKVPIISISAIRLNDDTVSASLTDFEVFSGYDNRRNPRIKIRTGTGTIYTENYGRAFIRAAYTEFDGSYGFVEEDGSTPVLIKDATLMLATNYLKAPLGSGSALTGVGPKKREKVDLHETEYFQPDDVRGGSTGAISGDIAVDRILKMYRGPVGIGGTIMDLARTEDFKRDRFTDVVI